MTVCSAIQWTFETIVNFNWIEGIKAVATVATTFVAFLALKNWKRQDKAKRQAEFLDASIEVIHTFVTEMSRPIALVQFAKIGMECHAPTWEGGDQSVKGAIAYIQKNGEADSKRLREALNDVQPSVIQLRALAAKGQIFKFHGYVKFLDAVDLLTRQFGKLEAFLTIIGSPTMNWEHPRILKLLKDVMAIEPDDIRKSLAENNVAALEFATKTYERIYG